MNRYKGVMLALMLVLITLPAAAQEAEDALQLSVHKDFGFGMGGRIQGKFTLEVAGPDKLARVEFLIDSQVVSVDREPPFRYSFNTSDYELGAHHISAIGFTINGEELRADERTFEFVSVEEGWQAAREIMVPMLVGTLALVLVAALGTMLLGRRKGAPQVGEYGVAGGAVCPRCCLPYARHFLSLNLLAGKLERCPYCGKWTVVRRATTAELAEAEARLGAGDERGELELESEETRLRRMIEDSRYEK